MIDADSVVFAVALGSEAIIKGRNGEPDEVFQVKDLRECYREVVARLEALVQEVGAEDALVCLTPAGKCYRYTLLPSYKDNRKAIRRPEVLRPLQAMVAEMKPFRTLAVWGLEADDVCGISSTSLQKANLREPVIVSIDKDMLQIPGLSYSWMAAARKGEIGHLTETSAFAADRMHLYQTLCGDPVDNYTGCPGVGPKKADKILDECVATQGVLDWAWIVEAFKRKGLRADYALTQARVARILRDTDWNPKLKEVTLWTPREFATCSPEEKPTVGASASASMAPSKKLITEEPSDVLSPPSKVILDERLGATLH